LPDDHPGLTQDAWTIRHHLMIEWHFRLMGGFTVITDTGIRQRTYPWNRFSTTGCSCREGP